MKATTPRRVQYIESGQTTTGLRFRGAYFHLVKKRSLKKERLNLKRNIRRWNNPVADQSTVSSSRRYRRLIKRRRISRCGCGSRENITWSVVVYDYVVFIRKKRRARPRRSPYSLVVSIARPWPCWDITGSFRSFEYSHSRAFAHAMPEGASPYKLRAF